MSMTPTLASYRFWSRSTPGILSRMMLGSARGCATATSVTITPSTGGMIGRMVFCFGSNIHTLYSVWMFDPKQNTILPIMPPVEGVMVTDVAVAQPRALPNIILDKIPGVDLDQNLYDANVGVIDIR